MQVKLKCNTCGREANVSFSDTMDDDDATAGRVPIEATRAERILRDGMADGQWFYDEDGAYCCPMAVMGMGGDD
jgi:hypothetical protein